MRKMKISTRRTFGELDIAIRKNAYQQFLVGLAFGVVIGALFTTGILCMVLE